MTRVVSVSSGRADIGILTPVWRALDEREDFDLHVFLTGMHQATSAPSVETVPARAQFHRGGSDLGGADGASAASAMAAIGQAAGGLYAEVEPDLVLVVGDRLDMLPAATAALPFNLPLAHLHGGEMTTGAVDDRIRHAITKLSHIHCVSSAGARDRVAAMGEEAWRIHVTGAPGLDMLLSVPEMDAGDFAKAIGLESLAGLRLVTVHPESNAPDPAACLGAVLSAFEARPGPTLFSAPNSDPGGAEMKWRIQAFAESHAGARYIDTLGAELYANALRHAAVMLGNSSSGVIEAGLFGLPVVNVGDRQKGRERGANVIDVPADAAAVGAALDRVCANPSRFAAETPYGDGKAAPRIAAALSDLPDRQTLLAKNGSAAVA